MCLIKKYLDNYIATTEGAQRSRALVEGGGHRSSVLVEKAVRYGSSRVNGFFSGGIVQFSQDMSIVMF
jgi:hypothetical protein